MTSEKSNDFFETFDTLAFEVSKWNGKWNSRMTEMGCTYTCHRGYVEKIHAPISNRGTLLPLDSDTDKYPTSRFFSNTLILPSLRIPGQWEKKKWLVVFRLNERAVACHFDDRVHSGRKSSIDQQKFIFLTHLRYEAFAISSKLYGSSLDGSETN